MSIPEFQWFLLHGIGTSAEGAIGICAEPGLMKAVTSMFAEQPSVQQIIVSEIKVEMGKPRGSFLPGPSKASKGQPEDNAPTKTDLDRVYRERNMCVALIAQLAESLGINCGIKQHEGEEWEDDWRNIFFLDLRTGQVSWHLHTSEVENFPQIGEYTGEWDGHTTEEKYARVKKYLHLKADERVARDQ